MFQDLSLRLSAEEMLTVQGMVDLETPDKEVEHNDWFCEGEGQGLEHGLRVEEGGGIQSGKRFKKRKFSETAPGQDPQDRDPEEDASDNASDTVAPSNASTAGMSVTSSLLPVRFPPKYKGTCVRYVQYQCG